MASLIAKKKATSSTTTSSKAPASTAPRIVQQTYLGSAERSRLWSGPPPLLCLVATTIDFGLPGALWVAAQQSGVWKRSNHFGLHRVPVPPRRIICCWPPSTASANPGRKPKCPTGTAAAFAFPLGLSQRALHLAGVLGLLRSHPDQLRRRDNSIRPVPPVDRLEDKQLVSRRLLAYDTTNFYTYVASTNTRNELAQRGTTARPAQPATGRPQLCAGREQDWSLCHHVYPGNVADAEEFPIALARMVALLIGTAWPEIR